MIFHLKILTENDVTQSYVDWFKNLNVIRYSSNQYRIFTLESQKNFVNSCLNNSNIDLYGIFHQNLHLGNIQINGLKKIFFNRFIFISKQIVLCDINSLSFTIVIKNF